MAEDQTTPQVPVEPPKPTRSLKAWFADNPLIGLIGTMASVISLPLAFLLFFLAQKDRDIRYARSESPTAILRNGRSSNLRVYYKDKELTSDVTSIQIAVWNAGRESVKRENILSRAIILKLDPPSRILEARVKEVTRNIVNFQLDVPDDASGILNCSWNVLEPGDGALLEVFYVGTLSEIFSNGIIEGQIPIRRVVLGQQAIYLSRWHNVMISLLAVLIALVVAQKRRHMRKPIADAIVIGVLSCSLGGITVILLMGLFQQIISHHVPFAF